VLGTTLDDAAGEAFDKGARLLGLGYPGGAAVDRLAREGDPEAYRFPVARVSGLDFSFSGLKTALLYAVRDLPEEELEARRADLAASYQRAIVTALNDRATEAAERVGLEQIAIVGGVAANSVLRATLPGAAAAPLELCTDNAAMIASAGRYATAIPFPEYLALDAYATAASARARLGARGGRGDRDVHGRRQRPRLGSGRDGRGRARVAFHLRRPPTGRARL